MITSRNLGLAYRVGSYPWEGCPGMRRVDTMQYVVGKMFWLG